MSFAQEYVDALRNGDSLRFISFVDAVVDKYQTYAQELDAGFDAAQLNQLLTYELLKTDIDESDFVKIHLVERLTHFGVIFNLCSEQQKCWLATLVASTMLASAVKQIDNYADAVPQNLDSDEVEPFLADNSVFSKLIASQSCQQEMGALSDNYIVKSSPSDIFSLFKSIKINKQDPQFCRSIINERSLVQLQAICNQYMQHLESVIENYIQQHDDVLHDEIFLDKQETAFVIDDDSNPGQMQNRIEKGGFYKFDLVCNPKYRGGLFQARLMRLIEADVNFDLAMQKFRATRAMQETLMVNEHSFQQKINSFTQIFNQNQVLFNTRRDTPAMTFLKGVATVLSGFFVLAINNFWQPHSQRAAEQIQETLEHQIG